MKIQRHPQPRGIALIMVLIVLTVLGILAGGFAYSMKVETKLARNSSFDPELEWLARSGIDYASYILTQSSTGPAGQVDSLNAKWAGGVGDTNDPASNLPLENVPLGAGTFSIKIVDLDRKFNINTADETILRQALTLIGVDASSVPTIVDSILDWRDPDDDKHMNGTESDGYKNLTPPYLAKNGPIDDLSELLLVNGITPAMYWGSTGGGRAAVLNRSSAKQSRFDEPTYAVGLVDLFTPFSSRLLNINTAAATAFQVFPEIDENIAQAIIGARAGPDGVEGTQDDTPFRSPADLARVPGIHPMLVQQIARYSTVKSLIFQVTVDVAIAGNKRQYIAFLRRSGPRSTVLLHMHWR